MKDSRYGLLSKLQIISNIMTHNSNSSILFAHLGHHTMHEAEYWNNRAFNLKVKRLKIKADMMNDGILRMTSRNSKRHVEDIP